MVLIVLTHTPGLDTGVQGDRSVCWDFCSAGGEGKVNLVFGKSDIEKPRFTNDVKEFRSIVAHVAITRIQQLNPILRY